MHKIICFFNHKGGVSKTTTVFNLGWMLARKGRRVLLIDCDPQCNLTGMILGFKNSENLEEISGTPSNPKNIRDGLAPAFESRPTPITAVECTPVPQNPNLFLLPGHIRLSEYENTLGISQELTGSLLTLQNLPGSIRFLFDETCKKQNIDIALVDVSPSLGPINQNLMAVSDYFVIPMHPDYFAMMALSSLKVILVKWRKWALAARGIEVLREAAYPFPEIDPKFLGYVLQKYRPRVNAVPAAAFEKWIEEIQSSVKNDLLPALRENGMMLNDADYINAGYSTEEPFLQMPDFNSLIARSQEHRVPIFELTDQQLDQVGVVAERSKRSMRNFEALFSEAADRLLRLLDHEASI